MATDRTDEVLDAVDRLLVAHPPGDTDAHEFLGDRFDAGLAWVWMGEAAAGGRDADPALQPLVDRRFAAAGAPPVPFEYNPIGLGMTGPTLLTHGTPTQQAAYLRELFTGREVWCQLFSEPSVGSDVAGLATMARRDGDEWVIDGQKVWTSFAHVAARGLLLARTDPEVPKHQGLTAFVVDMRAPGVEVRPLRQMTGEAEFNEVYFTGARVPDVDRLGDVGDGWRVATTTLMNERVSLGGGMTGDGVAPGAAILADYRRAVAANPTLASRRDEAVRLWITANVNRLTASRAAAAGNRGRPGPEGSVLKLASAEHAQRMAEFAVDLLGAAGMLISGYDPVRPGLPMGVGGARDTTKAFLRSRANTIEGGTSEILRNILGERVLGLPGDVRVDKGVPWRDVPR